VILFKDYIQEDINTSTEPSNSDFVHMPDEVGVLHGASDLVDDPFLAVASKIWNEEIS